MATSDKQIGQAPAPAGPTTAAPTTRSPGRQGQAERGDGTSSVHRAAVVGVSGQAAPLPFRDQIQKAFGKHDVSTVKAYSDPAAIDGSREINAEAYTTSKWPATPRPAPTHRSRCAGRAMVARLAPTRSTRCSAGELITL